MPFNTAQQLLPSALGTLLSARGGVPSSEMDGVALDGTPRHADADGGSLLGGSLTGSLVPTKVAHSRRSFQQRAQLRQLCERSARFVRCVQSILH